MHDMSLEQLFIRQAQSRKFGKPNNLKSFDNLDKFKSCGLNKGNNKITEL